MTNPYEHAFPARQETPEGEPMACTFCGWPEDHPCAVCGHSIHSILPRNCGHHVFDRPSQASPVGEAPRETAERCDACYQLQVEEGPGWRCGKHAQEARLSSPREETSEAVDSAFRRVTRESNPYGCGCACHTGTGYDSSCAHCAPVPRTSEEPTEGEWRRLDRTEDGFWGESAVWAEVPEGPGRRRSLVPLTLEQAIARQAAARMEERFRDADAMYGEQKARAEAAESRLDTLERELAEAHGALLKVKNLSANYGGAGFLQNGYSTIYHEAARALARPRFTEGQEDSRE